MLSVKWVRVGSFLLLVNCATGSSCDSGQVAQVQAQEANFSTVTFRIASITCGSCATLIKETLKRIDGVSPDIKVDIVKKQATVRYDPSKVTPKKLIEEILSVGHTAEVI